MKRKKLTVVLLFSILFVVSTQLAADQPLASKAKWSEWVALEGYTIGAGDVLAISVWNNEALTKQVTVLPDGKIRISCSWN